MTVIGNLEKNRISSTYIQYYSCLALRPSGRLFRSAPNIYTLANVYSYIRPPLRLISSGDILSSAIFRSAKDIYSSERMFLYSPSTPHFISKSSSSTSNPILPTALHYLRYPSLVPSIRDPTYSFWTRRLNSPPLRSGSQSYHFRLILIFFPRLSHNSRMTPTTLRPFYCWLTKDPYRS